MEKVATFRASICNISPNWASRPGPDRPDARVGSWPLLSNAWIQKTPLVSKFKMGNKNASYLRRCTATRASMQPSDSGSSEFPIAPLQMESPIGKFLSQILASHPHLVPAAVEQQLEQLQTDCEAEKEKEEPSASGTDLVLYRRIAEVKANERKKALEEILYALVVQKFMDASVSLVPAITPSTPDGPSRVDIWPGQDDKLERLHSPEAYEMIQNHLSLILGNQPSDSTSVLQISKLRVGQVYAASVMYGYFLKRVDQRFQLEKSMKVLPEGIDNGDEQVAWEETRPSDDGINQFRRNARPHPEMSSFLGGAGIGVGVEGLKPSRLRTYVMSFDGESLQKYATIRSKEGISIIEKHTEALFGRPEIVVKPEGTIDPQNDEIKITFGGLRRLVLEAVTFGSFLWDVESYVDSRYHFVAN
ncbi:UV-B-induced protein, chloroplastic-like [Salvia divinorum]|uniref:UV-B-induced protein, chloroplastic-like n=1 Tax=Salvia divinorum TaxID=28513 RepID=A0ABD1ICL4_SALDI